MRTGEYEDLRAYSLKLRTYSADELEDIYFHIHILRQPLRYRLLVRELEARRLRPGSPSSDMPRMPDLRQWLESRPFLARHAFLRAGLLAMLLFVLSGGVTLALLSPIWVFAIPLHFVGLQTALVYFACAPVPPILGAAVGGRLGGRGYYAVWVLLGVVTAMLLFNTTGAPSAILRMLMEPQGTGGMTWGGF